jgi:hypothetical protein
LKEADFPFVTIQHLTPEQAQQLDFNPNVWRWNLSFSRHDGAEITEARINVRLRAIASRLLQKMIGNHEPGDLRVVFFVYPCERKAWREWHFQAMMAIDGVDHDWPDLAVTAAIQEIDIEAFTSGQEKPIQVHERVKATFKSAFVDFIRAHDWDWVITIGIGSCDDDDELLERLRIIESQLCGKYVSNRYQKFADDDRYWMAVAFEGERKDGTRHAHILVHVPKPRKNCESKEISILRFPWQFMCLWHRVTFLWLKENPLAKGSSSPRKVRLVSPFEFDRANTASRVYTVKSIQKDETRWSRFEFVTPPKSKKFKNENLSAIRNRNRQRRLLIKKREADHIEALRLNA